MGELGDPFTYNTIEVPTVVGLLRNILTQYPDNGQIIKELVQNAEDAGATKVEVLYVQSHLTHPEAQQGVQRFLQGPSLCLYNDAVFSEEDWHGIRKLSDSIKKNNPLQVGQFGLGFKSVFHLTDYITIISGQQVLFMDPSEPEDKMCRSLPLNKLSEVLPAAVCLQSFGNYLNPQHLVTGNFPATVFWFPLRQQSSRISDTVYTPEHVKRLFDSFGVEADVCLTFLKSLEEITISKRQEQKVTVTHCMKITSSNHEEMRSKRRAFRQHLQQCKGSPSSALTCSYQATLQTGVDIKKEQSMRIFHFIPGKNDPDWMKWGGKDTSKHVPLVGVAVPTSPPSAPGARGHTFSFLPLPPDPTNQTHLPIQVNGAFILNQNRRQVKWRTSESSQEPDVVWNEELALKVVANAYTQLLKQLLQEAQSGTFDTATWYSFLPDLSKTTGRWQQMARKVWLNLLPLPIISSEVRGFLEVKSVLSSSDLNTLKPEVAKTVKSVLCSQSVPLATIPDHVQASIGSLGQQVLPITPQHLRDTLKRCSNLKNPEHLLCYAAKDKNYQDLSGLPLLPLQDQSWTTFKPRGNGAAVYLCRKEEAKALLRLEGQVVNVQVSHPVQKILQDVTASGRTQVCQFNLQQHGPNLLHQSVAHVKRHQPSKQQLVEWLSQVWSILQHLSLQSVEHIPLLPTSQPPQATCLTPLSFPVVVQKVNCQLSKPQVEVLSLLGVVVVPALPSYIRHIELQGYLYSSDRYGTTQALDKVARLKPQTANFFNSNKTEEQRRALISLIDTNSIQQDLRNLLTKLKMFKAQDMHRSVIDVCLEGVKVIAPEVVSFPVSYPETLLVPSVSQEQTLALSLGAKQLSKEDLCVRVLRSCCGDENISRLVSYILRDPQLVGSGTVLQELRSARFVPNVAGSLCRPSELYDPDDDECDALIGEMKRPDESFRQHYPLLRSLGLRKVREMARDDLVCLIKQHQNTLLSEADRTKKSLGLLKAINHRHDCPQVCQAVKGVPFVCGVSSRPGVYPTSLEWATSSGLLRPQDLMSCQYSDVLGSAVAMVKCDDVPSVAEVFGWIATPQVDAVIKHLRNITAAYQAMECSRYFNLIKKTYHQLAALLDVGVSQLASLKSECCVFTEQGFRTPAEVYVWPGNEDLQLQPYLHLLPLELRESERLFLHLGCAARQNPPLLLTVLGCVGEQHQGGSGSSSSEEVKRDQRLVVSVLDRLQHHLPELHGPLLLPVTTQDDSLELAEAGQSAYTEAATEWIDSDELSVRVVHQCVSIKLAKALGVAPLQNFLSAGGEAVMEWGQREPLTTRLHNLLRQYRDGVSVLKELVQNADDAGATTVRLLYDERQNEDSRTLVLGSGGMGECQGPALWVYNDALFSEQDFVNLRELGAGTKELQPTKIGKFGLGFCSIYNLTDVPSFVSGSSYVVFDPHMTHLNHVSNSPGIRFNFTDRRNSYMLRTLQGQFQPFRGVFGCDIQESGSFKGTLFRLPFRTLGQASTSKISSTCYSHGDVVQLLKMFSGVVGQLLLFTQHVSSISVSHLHAAATKPSEMVELFSASRSESRPVSVPRLTSSITSVAQSLLERAAALFSKQPQKFKWNGRALEEGSMAEVSVRHSRAGGDLCGIEEGGWSTTWVTCWHSGSGRLCGMAEAHMGKALPLSAVAVPVNQGSKGWQPQCLADLPPGFYREGYFHCFLPLPVKTFLPVQINGVLEVASDRTSLLTQTEDDRCALSWNATLLGDATVRAHLGVAEALKHLGLCAGSLYYAIWPVVGCGGGTLVEELTKSFYQTLEQEDLHLFLCGGGDWHPLSRCLFLEEEFLQKPQVGEVAFEFLETYLHSSSEMRLVRVPWHVQAGFDRQVLSKHTITQEVFFQQYFIPHLSETIVSSEKRDQLTLHLLDSGHHYMELLRPLSCIPTQPQGTLKPPCHLISPMTRIANMFSLEDERFPLKNFLEFPTRSAALRRLGMNTHSLSSELVVGRAETVAGLALACPECARHRVMELLHYISTQEVGKQEELADKLKSVPFLPVMPKPESWSVAWHGESPSLREESGWCLNHRGATSGNRGASLVLDCPAALCLPAFKPLVGSSHLLLEEPVVKKAPHKVLEKLGVIEHALDLPLQSVIEQLCVFSHAPRESENASMCRVVYEHLEDVITHVRRGKTLNSGNIDDIKKIRKKKVLITDHGFKEPNLFAMQSESDCAPDLFSARTEGLEKYQCLMDILGISENFDVDVVIKVIQKKRETFLDKRLSKVEVCQVSRLLSVLFKVKKIDLPLAEVLYLPDSQGYLRTTKDLCLEDGVELSSGKFLCLHPSISVSQDMCEWLGIKTKTRKRLQESSNRLPFGQKEPLTTRLRNILNEYPCDSGIMKELLQNADDAGATEVTFYKDFRHLPDQKLFDPKWAPLQGPAMIVYNNKGFTEQDLRSIQDLGNSSKNEDPDTTGQYGIGFNAVYHLTDAPSFITKGPQVPQGETLCMFDPHCWYDPSATPESPGVQLVNLNDLRKDHPDSFIGYLEQQLSEEGTMFRLPLRTTKDSLISKEILKEDDICKMLLEFEREMPQCLLFLRNIRKISIKKVQDNGRCEEEYCVEAKVFKECDLPVLSRKHGDTQEERDPCRVNMVRDSYRINILDSKGRNSLWLVVQQLGAEEKDSLPEIVREAFRLKTLNLLPHGGVALLLGSKFDPCNVVELSAIYSTSCYLPLPVKSGLPFSINGHFSLNSSRRDLWTGRGDAKGLWNEWLLKEVLVPAAVHAVEKLRTLLFPDEDDCYMTEEIYMNKVIRFHNVLPSAWHVTSEKWRNFVKWFYEQVRSEELHFFDSFIPETDLPPPPPPPPSAGYFGTSQREVPARVNRKGCLRWHAFHASGDEYPVYFSTTSKEHEDGTLKIADVFRRLGMKLSSDGMYTRLVAADPKFECPRLTPNVALEFIKSWDKDFNDRCRPGVNNKVLDTPFLKDINVSIVLTYIMGARDFSGTCVDKLPLLLTNDGVLGCFSVQNPVFLSTFCDLLPNFKKEFTSRSLVTVIERFGDTFKDVVKKFTPEDLGERLPHVLGDSYCAADAKLPITDKRYLKSLWKFVVEFVEKEYRQREQMDWTQSKTYILRTLGDWALYPVIERGKVFLIPVKNAWQVLDLFGQHGESVFRKLPLPVPFSDSSKDLIKTYTLYIEKPYIPRQLQLAATLNDPAAVLQLLDFHRESVNSFLQESGQRKPDEVPTHEILEYLGKHCQKSTLSRDKIRSLQIFKDPSGQLCTLLGRKLIVLAESVLKLAQLEALCAELSLLIISKPESVDLTNLYTYIEPNCIVGELDLYTRIILPHILSLSKEQRIFYLKHLNKNLPQSHQERTWSKDETRVVAALKSCHFIELDGTLETGNRFNDPSNPVFSVMGVANLPEAWGASEWHNLVILAGMVHKVTPEKFVEFASSLSARDLKVKEKSEVLCEYLDNQQEDFQSKISVILDIQFLVPKKSDELETLLPHHQTHTGLVAFSQGANPKYANIIWSTRSLLPSYATGVARKLQRHGGNKFNIDTPPEADILEHIVKLCSSMQETPEKSPMVVGKVMESIYDHLSKSESNGFITLKERDIPIIHIPNHKVFVSISLVVGSLEEEILPYLYKAPVFYGKFFGTLKKLGMAENATPNTYAQVLRMIHDGSKHNALHPQEAKRMKMALNGLVKFPYKLKHLSIPELYLPARDETLRSSSEMFVADNMELLLAIEKTFHEPIFVGFKALDIKLDDSSFVKLLPQRLQPKFLSEACKEKLQVEGMHEEASGLLGEIQELLESEEFKTGVLRIINHYKLQEGSSLTEEERKEVVALLATVTVRQVNIIKTIITLHDNPVGQRNRQFFLQKDGQGDQQILTLYLSKKIPSRLVPNSLYEMYRCLLKKWGIAQMKEFGFVFYCYGKPHDIHKSLDESDVKNYSAETPSWSLFKCDVGSYLVERFLPLLDNGFSEFHEKEIVCMKKYLCRNERGNPDEEEEDDIYLIVEVVRLVEKHATCQVLNTYEVNTSKGEPCLVIVKACQLFRFVRKVDGGALAEASATQEVESKEEIFRKIRKQLKEIWRVKDEQERRHLLRRLQFKWHPDKNPDQVELCTSVMQYMQSLVGRLEKGEDIPDEEDPVNAPRATPSQAYSNFFRPPPEQYRNYNNRRRANNPPRRPRSDLPEARKWHRQARSDLQAAESLVEESPSWAVFICYQAAEKVLLAALYVRDMDVASKMERDGPLERSLTSLALRLTNPRAVQLATTIQAKTGGFLRPLYPTFEGCPQDHYTRQDAQQVLLQSRKLVQVLGQNIE